MNVAKNNPTVQSAAALTDIAIQAMKAAGEWSWDHRGEIYSCLSSSFAVYVANPELAAGGLYAASALALLMAVNCGVAFL